MTKIIASDSEPNRAAYSESFLQPVPIQPGAGSALQCLLCACPGSSWGLVQEQCSASCQESLRSKRVQTCPWPTSLGLHETTGFLIPYNILVGLSVPALRAGSYSCLCKCCLRAGCPCACCHRALCCLNSAPLS